MKGDRASTLVLGCLTKLDPDVLLPFTASLRRAGFDGDLALIVGEYNPDAVNRLTAVADSVTPVDEMFSDPGCAGLVRNVRNRTSHWTLYELVFGAVVLAGTPGRQSRRWRDLEYRIEGLQALRYGLYRSLLRERFLRASQIFICDLRDVVFQSDPFASPVRGLEVYLEDSSQTIANSPHNSRWILDLYGQRALTQLSHEVVSCSGTVAGDREGMLNYLDTMADEVDRVAARWRRPLGSHDQGIHNWLLRTSRLPDASVCENERGRVLTIGAMNSFRRDASGLVLNKDATIPPVLHQYDRHPDEFAALVHRLSLLQSERG